MAAISGPEAADRLRRPETAKVNDFSNQGLSIRSVAPETLDLPEGITRRRLLLLLAATGGIGAILLVDRLDLGYGADGYGEGWFGW